MILLMLFNLISPAHGYNIDDKYLTIKKVNRTVVSKEDASFADNQLKLVKEVVARQEATVDPLAIMETFTKLWQVVKDNQPVVKMDTDKFATALPSIAKTEWSSIGGWKPERNITIRNVYTNLYGMEVIRLEYQVKFIYGGNVNGKGLYIASAKIIPTEVDVAWGYNLNVVASAPITLNARTPQDPLAVIYLNINYVVSTVIKNSSITDTYQVQGDGLMKNTKTNRILFPAVL